jgi:hypothetical protein
MCPALTLNQKPLVAKQSGVVASVNGKAKANRLLISGIKIVHLIIGLSHRDRPAVSSDEIAVVAGGRGRTVAAKATAQ